MTISANPKHIRGVATSGVGRILDDVGADGVGGLVGSINLDPGSFDSRRELAIEVYDDHVIEGLHEVARQTTGSIRIHWI